MTLEKLALAAIAVTIPFGSTARAQDSEADAPGPILIVLNKSEAEAALVDPATYEVIDRLPTGDGPHEVAISPDGRFAYVADYGQDAPGNTITVLDLVDREVETTWDLLDYTRPHGIVTSADGGVVWVTVEGARAVLEIDAATGEIREVWRTDQDVSHMVASTPDESKLYVANIGSGSVSVIDRAVGSVTTIPTGEGAEGIGITPDGREAWVSNRGEGSISVIEVETDEVVATFPSGGEVPIRIEITPDGSEAWVSNAGTDAVTVFDVEDRTLQATLEVGAVPVGILISPDGTRAFVANTRADRVTVFDVASREKVGTFTTGIEPDGMAWRETPRSARRSAPPPAAEPADVESIDAIVTALYDVISGPAGERDWTRFRTLFAPGALLVPAAPGPEGSSPLRTLTVEGYVERTDEHFSRNAFYETEIARETSRFGNVASLMSAYESRRDPAEEPFSSGINAITLVSDGERWYVVSVAWDVDRAGNEIPFDFGSRSIE